MTQHRIPPFVYLMAISAAAMILPAIVGAIENDFVSARAYLQGGLLLGVVTFLVGIVTRRPSEHGNSPRSQLLTLLGVYTAIPMLVAVPHLQALGQGGYWRAAFDMISAATTTGGTIYDHWQSVPRAAHLWQAELAWLGGFLTWVAAAAILAPMNLGGFEVRAPRVMDGAGGGASHLSDLAGVEARLAHFTRLLAPVYGGLTGMAWLFLMIAGDDELIALCHAMSVMATSGISAVGGVENAPSGLWGEGVLAIFFVFALSRASFTRTMLADTTPSLWRDPEIRIGVGLIGATALVLYFRHWLIAGDAVNAQALRALWGAIFTSASFLTTTGFASAAWTEVSWWSGLEAPGLVLIGLAIIGGGVATTAGGVKLMRIYALSLHLRREVDLLILPHSVSGGGAALRRIRKQGAQIAWVMFMLFAISITVVMTLLSLDGVQFETAMVLTVAALSNCGPLSIVAGEIPVTFTEVPVFSQVVLAIAMVAGRIESLAIIALMNPEIWRR